MKKATKVLLTSIICVGMALAMTGCSKSEPYSDYDLSEYITLPDYNSFETKEPEVEITDDQIDQAVEANLQAAATSKEVKEGTVQKGDTIKISYEGTLEDGTTSDGMKSEGSSLELGSGSMIDGFEEGLYGATIGEEVTLNLQFPDPYENNQELSGKKVTFKVKVLSKTEVTVPELNEDFVKKNSDFDTVEEYRADVAKQLEQNAYDEQLYQIKGELYSKIVEETEVKKYPEKELEEEKEAVIKQQKDAAEKAGTKWEDYLKNTLKMEQDEFDKNVDEAAKSLIKQEMVIYAIAEKEDLSVTDEEYDEYLNTMMENSGIKDKDEFKNYTGMSLEEYAEENKLDRDLLLTKELDKIYDRLIGADDDEGKDDADKDDAKDSADKE